MWSLELSRLSSTPLAGASPSLPRRAQPHHLLWLMPGLVPRHAPVPLHTVLRRGATYPLAGTMIAAPGRVPLRPRPSPEWRPPRERGLKMRWGSNGGPSPQAGGGSSQRGSPLRRALVQDIPPLVPLGGTTPTLSLAQGSHRRRMSLEVSRRPVAANSGLPSRRHKDPLQGVEQAQVGPPACPSRALIPRNGTMWYSLPRPGRHPFVSRSSLR